MKTPPEEIKARFPEYWEEAREALGANTYEHQLAAAEARAEQAECESQRLLRLNAAVAGENARLRARLATVEAALSNAIDAIMQDVVDLEYNTCEDDNPDLCHVTTDELRIILTRNLLGEDGAALAGSTGVRGE